MLLQPKRMGFGQPSFPIMPMKSGIHDLPSPYLQAAALPLAEITYR